MFSWHVVMGEVLLKVVWSAENGLSSMQNMLGDNRPPFYIVYISVRWSKKVQFIIGNNDKSCTLGDYYLFCPMHEMEKKHEPLSILVAVYSTILD